MDEATRAELDAMNVKLYKTILIGKDGKPISSTDKKAEEESKALVNPVIEGETLELETVILDDNVVQVPDRDFIKPKVNTFFGEEDENSANSAHDTSQV